MRIRRPLPLLTAAAAGVLLPAAWPAAAAPRTHVVVVDKMKFGPLPQQVRRGDVIVWDNRDMFRHSATARGKFDIDLPAGKKVSARVETTGAIPFVCKYHPGMKAVLRVAK